MTDTTPPPSEWATLEEFRKRNPDGSLSSVYRYQAREELKTEIAEAVLHCPMDHRTNGANTCSVGQYLKILFLNLWNQGIYFNSKRPFGDSDWQFDIYIALAKNEIIHAKFNEYDELSELTDENRDYANELIQVAITHLFKPYCDFSKVKPTSDEV